MGAYRLCIRIVLMTMLTIGSASAQEDIAGFYKGRSISLVIGGAAGGGYDTYARLVARYMQKYIPGNPNFVTTNMPGAGGNIAAAHVYNRGAKDGTMIGAVLPGSITDALFRDRSQMQHDPAKLIYLGSANSEVNMCYVRSDTGITSIQELANREVAVGASSAGGSTRDQPTVQKNLLGSKFKIVSGYPGTVDIFLAIERNEVSGICGIGLPAFRQQRAAWLDSGFMRIISQDNAKGDPKITALGVPRTVDLARNPADRKVMELIYAQQSFGRPYILPPGTPDNKVATLRRAFMEALNDHELLAAAEKIDLDIAPVSGSDLQKLVEEIYAMPADVVEAAKQALVLRDN